MTSTCLVCRVPSLSTLVDFGPQPICNRFIDSPSAVEARFPMQIGQCGACGLVQSATPVPATELKPRYDWISYREPEAHLDHLADVIAGLPGLATESVFCGVSYKDDTLLRRLSERGYPRSRRLEPRLDLGVGDSALGVETIQDRLTPATAVRLVARQGTADVIVARHIWEHAADPAGFVVALQTLLASHGYLVLEVPDCERALATCDYSTIWEEHTLYFTPATFRQAVTLSGLIMERYECFPYTLENSLVAITRKTLRQPAGSLGDTTRSEEIRRGELFGRGLDVQRKKFRDYLLRFRREQGAIAVFGAGHLACTFINLLQLADLIDCLIDDDPNKRGLFMPGSHLPIYDSAALVRREIALCLLSVSPEAEERVVRNNPAFFEVSGRFASIFPASKYALWMSGPEPNSKRGPPMPPARS